MFQLIHQDNGFERREQKLREGVTYYAGLPGEFNDEEAMYEVDIPPHVEEQRTDKYDIEDSSDVFIGPVA